MSATYRQFLESKRIRFQGSGLQPEHLSDGLFHFQHEIVRWALDKGRACIFADCGLGKTIMQLEWASHLPGRTLLVAPLAVAHQTEREAKRFGYDARVVQRQVKKNAPQITITNYHKLERFDISRFDAIVLDESSILKSYDGAFRNLIVESAAPMRWKLACTATPAPNDFMELGNHSEFMGAMTRAEMLAMFFVHDGGSTQDWRLKGHARSEFWRWICSWAVLCRRPSDLGFTDEGFDLPPLNFSRVLVESPYTTQALFDSEATLDMMERRRARKASITERCGVAAEMVNASNEPWLLWCDLNAESEMLAGMIPDAVQVRGSDSPDTKADRMLGFADGTYRVLVTKPRIAGFGMNWQHCHRMIFVGLSDSYEALYQATRRCWRFGQEKPVEVYIIHSAAETVVVDNVLRKEQAHAELQDRMVEIVREALGRA